MKKARKLNVWTVAMVAITVMWSIDANAQDWAQWRGANREDISNEKGLNLDWTVEKPALAWTFREAGSGYSAPTVAGTTLYCQGAENGSDIAFALDTKTGALKWKEQLGKEFVQDRGNGSRGSVTVDGDKLYLIRGGGQLHCLSAADGKTLWQKDFRTDFGGNIMSNNDWGYSESPLVDGNLVICTPGGDNGAMAALNKTTGAVVWRSKECTDLGGYSSPIVVEIDGVRQYIQLMRKGLIGVAAKDGKLLWSAGIAGNNVAAIPTPIYHDHIVYATSGYNAGCGAVKIAKEGDQFTATTLYANKNMVNHHGGVILLNGYIYGFSDAGGWECQDFKTGEVLWKHRPGEPNKGAVLCVDGRLLCLDEKTGSLTVAAASTEGWKESGRLEIPERTQIQTTDNRVWTHPVVVNGKLYLRDHNLLFCFNLKK